MKKIKIVQIGIGHDHAWPNFNAICAHPELFDVRGYVRVEKECKDENFNRLYPQVKEITLEEAFAIPDLDAVSVETFDLYLVKYAQMAAERGLHVFMDKPGSESCEDFERLLSTVKKNRKVFAMGYMYRFNPVVKKTLRAAREGKLGVIYSVEAHMSRDDVNSKRQWLEAFQGGMTFYLGCHLVDLIYAFMGMPEEIIPYNVNTGVFGVTSKDYGMAVFRYPNGVSFLRAAATEPGGFMRRQLVVCGSLGTVEVKPLEAAAVRGTDLKNTTVSECYRKDENTPYGWDDKGEAITCEAFQRYEGMFLAFAKRVQSGEPSTEAELLYEARVHRLVLAACGIDCDYKGKICL